MSVFRSPYLVLLEAINDLAVEIAVLTRGFLGVDEELEEFTVNSLHFGICNHLCCCHIFREDKQ